MQPETDITQMKKGILEFCVLLIISKERIYSSEIIKELVSTGLVTVEGTIYPMLSRLNADGFLKYSWEESPSGPPRKYYELSKSGQEKLESFKIAWGSISSSINLLLKKYGK